MTLPRPILMAANWKMYKTRSEAKVFLSALETTLPQTAVLGEQVRLWVSASFTLLETLVNTANNSKLPLTVSAQTMDAHAEGAYTGEVSARMLQDLGVKGVLLGHSERRQYFNETDEALAQKVKVALEAGLEPVLCVGETLEQREAEQTDRVILNQLNVALQDIPSEALKSLIIAYEPVWAIGTGKVCDAAEANRVCGLIRNAIADIATNAIAQPMLILYGGSMKPDNATELLQQEHIDGGLIGGASLQPDSYLALVEQALAVQSSIVSV
jgi:triosephosphate isomerase (TIM)